MKDKDTATTETSKTRQKDSKYIRFDWAMKDLLRQKGNFSILDGFLTSLLGYQVSIVEILGDNNKPIYQRDRLNRIDIVAINAKGEKILIEVQNDSEDFFYRPMSYTPSELITSYIDCSGQHDNIANIIRVNIVYFGLRGGSDHLYCGKTEFRSMNDGEVLEVPKWLKNKYDLSSVSDFFTQNLLLKVHAFDRWTDAPLDQWLYFLSTSTIPEDATAPGLQEAREKLRIDALSHSDRESYYQHLDNMTSAACVLESAIEEGLYRGYKAGIQSALKENSIWPTENPSPSNDSWFDNPRNLAEVNEGIRQYKAGEITTMSLEEVKSRMGV